jgi:hypothetical protein
MSTTTRAKRFPPLIDAVIKQREADGRWNHPDQARVDANCVFESLLAQCGVDAAVEAIQKQGLRGDYRFVIEALHEEAVQRRSNRKPDVA